MFICNDVDLKTRKFECGKIVGNYLVKNGIPLLFRDGNNMVFSNTKKLQKVVNSMPFYLKLLVKVGELNG